MYSSLWKFQQEHRVVLTQEGLERWDIGEIASKIGQLYFNYYLRTSELRFLVESFTFYDAIRQRQYFFNTPQTAVHSLCHLRHVFNKHTCLFLLAIERFHETYKNWPNLCPHHGKWPASKQCVLFNLLACWLQNFVASVDLLLETPTTQRNALSLEHCTQNRTHNSVLTSSLMPSKLCIQYHLKRSESKHSYAFFAIYLQASVCLKYMLRKHVSVAHLFSILIRGMFAGTMHASWSFACY